MVESATAIPLSCQVYGSGQGDEGICLQIQLGEHRVLLDCGLADVAALCQSETAPVSWVICTHAHPDHAQGIATLAERYPQLPIYMSAVTAHLVSQQPDLPIATERFEILPWRSPVELHPTLQVQLLPAGHLPGAASILLTYTTAERTYALLYTGDFCLANARLVEGLSLESLRGMNPDVLIVEGTYGRDRYPRHRQLEKRFLDQLDRELLAGRSIWLLAPPLGMGQEILMLLRSHHQFTGRKLDIWVDRAIAHYCDAYLDILPYLPTAAQNFARHQPLFWDARVLPRVHRLTDAVTLQPAPPCIVLSDRLPAPLPEPIGQWCCFVPQRELQQMSFSPAALRALPCSVIPYCLTNHGDGHNILQLIHTARPQHVVFVHGTPRALNSLISTEELQSRYHLHSPAVGTTVELPVSDRFIQPQPTIATTYPGEINESGVNVAIALPLSVQESPAWATFADTGVVEARWQDNELVIRGLSQRDLMRQSQQEQTLPQTVACQHCRFFQQKICQNPRSPLYRLAVTPEGNCPAFEPLERHS